MSLINANKTTDYPIQQSQRKCTDLVCTFSGLLFTLILILFSLFLYNYTHQIRTSFPSDSAGKVCGLEVKGYPYVYFANFPKINRRVCVSSCPPPNATALNCFPTASVGCTFNPVPAFYVGYYSSQPANTNIGSFCEPTNPTLRSQLYQNIGVSTRFAFFSNIGTIIVSLLIGLLLSAVFTLLVQFFPRQMTYVTVGTGCAVMIIMAIFILVFPSAYVAVRIILVILLLLLLLTIGLGWKNQKGTFKMYSEFTSYATEMVTAQKGIAVYVPIFLGIMALFLLCITLEIRSLWSSAPVNFNSAFVFWQFAPGGTTIWTVLVFIQTVWGLAFIKQAFNFCVSGNSAQWYFSRIDQQNKTASLFLPLKYLILKHFGSVVASSFMTGWFTFPDYIFDCIRSDAPPAQGSTPSACQRCLNPIDNFFDLVRSDCMCYIYLTGNPYCNSARYCQFLCGQSAITINSQSISRFYRICAHFLLAGLMALINLLLQGSNKSVFTCLVVFILGIFTCTFFISLHADATESIQIIFLLDEYFAQKQLGTNKNKQFNDATIKKMKLNKPFASKISQLYNQNG